MRFVFVLPTIKLQLLIVIGALEVARGEDTGVLCEDILLDDIIKNRPSGQIGPDPFKNWCIHTCL
jgi:hypothetical protein